MTDAAKKKPAKPKRGLDHALLDAQLMIHSIGKDGANKFHGYDYTSAEHMLAETRPVLLDCGIVVRAGKKWQYERPNGGLQACMEVIVSHPDSGEKIEETVELPACPGKGRPEDKAVLASETTLLNYYLRGLLLIPRVDVEVCSRDDTGVQAPKPTPKPAPKPAPKAEPEPKPAPKESKGAGVPVTDKTLEELRGIISDKYKKAKVNGKDFANAKMVEHKEKVLKATGAKLSPDQNIESVKLEDLRDQFSEDKIRELILDFTIPF